MNNYDTIEKREEDVSLENGYLKISDFINGEIKKIFFNKKLLSKEEAKSLNKFLKTKNDIKSCFNLPKTESGFFVLENNELKGFNEGDMIIMEDHSYVFFNGEKIHYLNHHGDIIGTDEDKREYIES